MMELKTATAEVMQESASLNSPDIIMNPAAPSRTVHHYRQSPDLHNAQRIISVGEDALLKASIMHFGFVTDT